MLIVTKRNRNDTRRYGPTHNSTHINTPSQENVTLTLGYEPQFFQLGRGLGARFLATQAGIRFGVTCNSNFREL